MPSGLGVRTDTGPCATSAPRSTHDRAAAPPAGRHVLRATTWSAGSLTAQGAQSEPHHGHGFCADWT